MSRIRDEQQRLAELRAYKIVDTPPEPVFDRVAQFAAKLFDAPISLVTFIDEHRQWFKARHAFDPNETSREYSFCDHAIRGDEVFVVQDALEDSRFKDNPLVTGSPGIRFYAGAPIKTKRGHRLGTVCVIDTKPRGSLTIRSTDALQALAEMASAELELRRTLMQTREFGETHARLSAAILEIGNVQLLDDLPELAARKTREVLGARRACITLHLDELTEGQRCVAVPASDAEGWRQLRSVLKAKHQYPELTGSSLPRRITRQLLQSYVGSDELRDTASCTLYVGDILVCPIASRNGDLFGVVEVAEKAGDEFNDDDASVLVQLTRGIADEVEHLRLLHEARKTGKRLAEQAHTLEVLNRTGTAIAAELDLEHLVQMVTDAGVELTGAQFGAFFYNVTSESDGHYMLYVLSGVERAAFEKFPMPRNTAVFGPTFKGEGVIRSNDITQDALYGKNEPYHGMPEGHLPVKSYLAVPVVSRSGKVLGGLFFGHAQPGIFTTVSEQIMVGIAAQAAVAIDNALLFEVAKKEIEERKKIEEALRQSQERYRTLFDSAPHAVIVTDRETLRLVAVNHAAVRLYGWSQEEMLAMTVDDFYAPENLPAVATRRRTFSADATQILRELRHRKQDGTFVDVEMAVRFIEYNGRASALAIVTDVSERLSAERARATAEEQLRQSQRLEAVGKLTGGIAHDFNNILMVIMANVEAVIEGEEDASTAKERLENIGGAAERAAQLTRQLLAFSRKQTLRLQRIMLNDLVVTTSTLLRRTLGEHVELDAALADDLWPIHSDHAQVEAALVNLCINARDAMPAGGRLLIETRNAKLDADYVMRNPGATEGDYVMLSVTDSGSGIPPDVLANVFEPFFTTKEVGKGTGLGLSMVYGFVMQSQGHVTIHSEVGHGTAVKLYLPRGEQETSAEAVKPATPVPRGTERILVVEDEQAVRAVVAQQLTSLGYTVSTAAGGSEGLTILRSGQTYDLLLTDVIMPGPVSGKALADEATKLLPGVRLLFMSGYSEDAISTLGILNPGVALLSKPFRKADLAQAIRNALRVTRGSSSSNR